MTPKDTPMTGHKLSRPTPADFKKTPAHKAEQDTNADGQAGATAEDDEPEAHPS